MEEWTIQNRTAEVHEFHMHQIHFLVEAINGVADPEEPAAALRRVPGRLLEREAATYPSITVKLDFRGPTVGDFVYHCHILDHEDWA